MYSNDEIHHTITEMMRILGYTELRPNQECVVMHFLSGNGIFISLCYCLLPKAFDVLRNSKTPDAHCCSCSMSTHCLDERSSAPDMFFPGQP